MAEVHGHCSDRFEPLRAQFQNQFATGGELGASVAVLVDGVLEVDLWGGWVDAERTRPWVADTITNVWSTTKTMVSLAALTLVERGELDPAAPVSRYWPEFADAGKADVEVRHLMSHTSGLSGWQEPIALEDIYDWPRSTGLLAAQQPWWKPGTASGYHALTQGHLVGEVIRRITGLRTGEFLAAEIAGPLRADFHIGLDPGDFDRVANVIPPTGLPVDVSALDPDGITVRTFSSPAADATASWTDGWRTADIGAANGHGNARSVARLQSVVSHGGELDGVRLLSPGTVDRIFEVQSDGVDLVLNVPVRFGLGYGIPDPALMPMLAGRRVCFWGGWGGSLVFNDVDRRVTVAYVMNEMGSDLLGKPSAMTCVGTALSLLG